MWAAAVALVGVCAGGAVAAGQDNPAPDQMRKMYDDALAQLKAAQERKNQLAAENEKLGQQLEAARKELAAAAGRLDELRRADADHAEKTFFLRSHYMAWQQFVGADAGLAGRWRAFLGSDYLAGPRDAGGLLGDGWRADLPILPPGVAAATQPAATAPATTATQPATTQAATKAADVPQPGTLPAGTRPTTVPASTLPVVPLPATMPAATLPATRPA